MLLCIQNINMLFMIFDKGLHRLSCIEMQCIDFLVQDSSLYIELLYNV